MKVVEADKFYVDLNFNSEIDDNELVHLKNINAYTPIKTLNTIKYSRELGLNVDEYLKAGFLARHWAIDKLQGKSFKIISIDKCESNLPCYIELDYFGQNLSVYLLQNGLAYVSKNTNNQEYYKFQDVKQAIDNAHSLDDLEFGLLNLNSNIVHKINCKHAKTIKKAELILLRHIKSDKIQFCKECFDYHIKEFKSILKPSRTYKISFHRKFDNFELYFINPLEFKKPNCNCNTEICKRLLDEINSSQISIDLALYGIGEQDEIYKALLKAKNRGVKIRSVVDSSKKDIYSNTNRFIQEFSSVSDNLESLMHNKFIIFDSKLVMTGSTNISSTGTGGYNSNISIFIKDEDIVKRYNEEFLKMYSGYFSKNKSKSRKYLNNSDFEVYFSPQDKPLENAILPNLNSAKKYIYVSIFYLTDWNIINSLIDAKNRGVRVMVLMDSLCANNFKNRLLKLKENKIPVIVEAWGGKNHEKTIAIDDRVLIIGSSNFSKNAFYKNDENILVIKNFKATSIYADYFLYLFNSINKKYMNVVPRAEGFESINSCNDGIDNNFDGLVDGDDVGCKILK